MRILQLIVEKVVVLVVFIELRFAITWYVYCLINVSVRLMLGIQSTSVMGCRNKHASSTKV